MIEKFQRTYEKLRKIVGGKNKRIKELEDELEEYRKRHPSTVGVKKNGKTYEIAEANKNPEEDHIQQESGRGKPGAQISHKVYSRIILKITRRVKVHPDLNECSECHSTLIHKGTRKRIVEGMSVIEPGVVKYRLDRLYCMKCRRIYEPKIQEAFPGSLLSTGAMLTVAYFRITMRMSIENTSTTMMQVFGIHISEGEIQNILSQFSDALGNQYETLLTSIRNAQSRRMDSTSWNISGNPYNLWTFLTKSKAIFHMSKGSRNEVPSEAFKVHNGTDVHDRHFAFETLAKATRKDKQHCWSHIICDTKELEEFYGYESTRIKRSVQTVFEEAKTLNCHGTTDDMERLYHKLVFLLDSDYEHKRSRRFEDNLLKRKKE